MNQDNSVLRSEDELIASVAPEDRASIETMIAARKQFDEAVEPIITAMLAAAQSDETAAMDDHAMAVANGIQQALTGHLGKIVAVIGIGTEGDDGGNCITANTQQCITALVETVRMTAEILASMKANRENDNG